MQTNYLQTLYISLKQLVLFVKNMIFKKKNKNGKGGISCKLVGALEMALLFALFESFLAGTSNGSFLWVYKWWGVLPVFVTTYIPFFLASNYVPDMKHRKAFLIGLWGLVALLLIILIPLGII